MYNKPSGNTGQISIGPGIIRVGPSGTTPSFDVGFVSGDATLMFKREAVDVRAGSPQIIIDRLASAEDLSIEFTGIEWDMDVLLRAIGDGASSVSAPNELFKTGGRPKFDKYAVQFEHRMADGGTLTLNIWKAAPSGEIEATIALEEPHNLSMKFDAMDVATDWAGATLAAGSQLASLIRTIP